MQVDTDVAEDSRLTALAKYDILDTPPEEAFDRITRLTARIFDVPISTVTFLDGHRQWFKSRQGLDVCETEKGPAFCNILVGLNLKEPLIVPDTLIDARFKDNPLVLGPPYLRFYAGTQLRATDGTAIGTLCAMDTKPRAFTDEDAKVLSDLAAIVMSELELRTLVLRDSLTGALARQAFRQESERTFALARRHKHPLSCIVFDLDHFKTINDENGHATGDLVLKACVEVCHQELRTSDLVGRLGGEEFAIILPHVNGEAAMGVAHKLRSAFERVFIPGKFSPLRFSASFGVATLDQTARDMNDLLERADQALYAAKAAGRNCCSAWKAAGPDLSGSLRRVFKAGRISFNAGRSTIDCTVRGLSDTAASLDVTSTAGIPQRFKLQIGADNLSRSCTVATMRDKTVQVQFA
jgi:diguanylate cyclase (GGDEF)-like protein